MCYFQKEELQFIQRKMKKLANEYHLSLDFVIGTAGRYYVLVSLGQLHSDRKDVAYLESVISKRKQRNQTIYPYGEIFPIHVETYLEDFAKVATFCTDLEAFRQAFEKFDHRKIPKFLPASCFYSIVDVYGKWVNDYSKEHRWSFQRFLMSMMDQWLKKSEHESRYQKFFVSTGYNRTKGKLWNFLRYINIFRNKNKISFEHLCFEGTDMKGVSVSASVYKEFQKRLKKEYPHVLYSAKKSYKNHVGRIFKDWKDKNNPFYFETLMEDRYCIFYFAEQERDVMQLLLRIKYPFSSHVISDSKQRVFAFQLLESEWGYWKSFAKLNKIPFDVDDSFSFLRPERKCIPIVTKEESCPLIQQYFSHFEKTIATKHHEIPEKERIHINGITFQSGAFLSREEQEFVEKSLREGGQIYDPFHIYHS